MSTARTYSYEELSARLEQVFGERPSRSALRAAAAQGRRTKSTLSKPRLTVGMPSPLPRASRTAPAEFDVGEVEDWLEQHPRLGWNRALSGMRDRLARGDDTEQVVEAALAGGLSWRTITALLVENDGRRRSVTAVHKRYRHLSLDQ